MENSIKEWASKTKPKKVNPEAIIREILWNQKLLSAVF